MPSVQLRILGRVLKPTGRAKKLLEFGKAKEVKRKEEEKPITCWDHLKYRAIGVAGVLLALLFMDYFWNNVFGKAVKESLHKHFPDHAVKLSESIADVQMKCICSLCWFAWTMIAFVFNWGLAPRRAICERIENILRSHNDSSDQIDVAIGNANRLENDNEALQKQKNEIRKQHLTLRGAKEKLQANTANLGEIQRLLVHKLKAALSVAQVRTEYAEKSRRIQLLDIQDEFEFRSEDWCEKARSYFKSLIGRGESLTIGEEKFKALSKSIDIGIPELKGQLNLNFKEFSNWETELELSTFISEFRARINLYINERIKSIDAGMQLKRRTNEGRMREIQTVLQSATESHGWLESVYGFFTQKKSFHHVDDEKIDVRRNKTPFDSEADDELEDMKRAVTQSDTRATSLSRHNSFGSNKNYGSFDIHTPQTRV